MAGHDLDDVLEDFLANVESAAKLSVEDQEKISAAGAKAFQSNLQKIAKERHYRDIKTQKELPLAKDIVEQDSDIDGQHTGTATVGWGNTFNAYKALWIAYGTKHPVATKTGRVTKHSGQQAIVGDNFVEEARNSSADDIAEAEAQVYKEIVEGAGDNNDNE
ncbi:hypothetical protein [Furfurilactobacillus milii]|uniref:HK97 gp10 family phage protein n=1 Tax=Furfurilactobacillus rossiae TaxID=231049 RepID=A0A7C9N531_9LACO|nr:hypothetical protein [Furfurilactobacillus milii]MYV04446.1 hypothetical protein [Furfurilactobacillus milii]